LAEYLRPTASSPNDGIVLAKAREIVGARAAPLEKARAIYDWIVDNTFRRAEARGCGLGNIALMLESGDLGGKCADINSLFVGLARAAGLPARDFFGIRVADSRVTKSLGKSGDITKAQHCRAEVYIENKGWLPVDPIVAIGVKVGSVIEIDTDQLEPHGVWRAWRQVGLGIATRAAPRAIASDGSHGLLGSPACRP
jgi:transglutaminase-like putative cysteine protease